MSTAFTAISIRDSRVNPGPSGTSQRACAGDSSRSGSSQSASHERDFSGGCVDDHPEQIADRRDAGNLGLAELDARSPLDLEREGEPFH